MSKRIVLIPYACGAGASTLGTESGPADCARRGLTETLRARGLNCAWAIDPARIAGETDMPPLGDPGRKAIVMRHAAALRDNVEAALRDGALPVTIGGDHSMAAGSVAGLARAKNAHGRIGLLWIDAHADINTSATSPSQALHGMPVAALLGQGDADFAGLGGAAQPVLRPEHIFYLGLRDVDAGETDTLELMNISHMTADEVKAMGYGPALRAAMDKIARGTDYLFLSLDIDAFDPAFVPATGTPVPGGFAPDEFLPVLAEVMAAYSFSAVEITEYNPTLPGVERTYETLVQSLSVMLGAKDF